MLQLYTIRVTVILLIFAWLESSCDLVRIIPLWFQIISQIVIHIYLFEAYHTSLGFWQAINYFGIKWTTMQIYLYLCMDVIIKNSFMSMHIYPIPGQDAFLFQWTFIFEVLPQGC